MSAGFVYVLGLADQKYYVGWASNPVLRIEQHVGSDGSEWTRKHPPLTVIQCVPGDKTVELNTTKSMMRKYGWANVRGGPWCQVDMKIPPPEIDQNYTDISEKVLCHLEDTCYNCKQPGHYAAECPKRALTCFCGRPARIQHVKRDSPNHGRPYGICHSTPKKCTYFEFIVTPTVPTPPPSLPIIHAPSSPLATTSTPIVTFPPVIPSSPPEATVPVVQHTGYVTIYPHCVAMGVKEWSAQQVRTVFGGAYSLDSTYIVFPSPDTFLFFFSATGYICFHNSGTSPITLRSHQNMTNGMSKVGAIFTLVPGARQGFDIRTDGWLTHQGFAIRKDGWIIEVTSGDAATLCAYDFALSGGGKGNLLGMCPP